MPSSNPLTVIRNEAAEIAGGRGKVLREQISVLTRLVERHLSRATIAGSGTILGARTSVETTAEDLRFSMRRLYGDRGLDIRIDRMAGLWFQGDAEDLEEMMGNLMDNACKWARGAVVVTGERSGARLLISIEDDGPGIPEKRVEDVLKRGRRLDETMPGSGLGLDIVQDIAEHYQGGSSPESVVAWLAFAPRSNCPPRVNCPRSTAVRRQWPDTRLKIRSAARFRLVIGPNCV